MKYFTICFCVFVVSMLIAGLAQPVFPAEDIHTLRVYEDGSYILERKDGTMEMGCLKGGLCDD